MVVMFLYLLDCSRSRSPTCTTCGITWPRGTPPLCAGIEPGSICREAGPTIPCWPVAFDEAKAGLSGIGLLEHFQHQSERRSALKRIPQEKRKASNRDVSGVRNREKHTGSLQLVAAEQIDVERGPISKTKRGKSCGVISNCLYSVLLIRRRHRFNHRSTVCPWRFVETRCDCL